jgi:hypothetical protein
VAIAELPDALAALREPVAGLRFGLDLPGAAAARRERADLVGQVDDYLLPRLRQLDAPLLAVVGGSTGAGKSTLINTLVGEEVSLGGGAAAYHPGACAGLPSRRPALVRLRPGPA